MSHRHVHTGPQDIIPVTTIPTFAECLETPTHADHITIAAQLDNIDGVNITHQIYGYLRGLNDNAAHLIATYNNLETLTSAAAQGVYDHFLFKGALRFRAIGVRYNIGGGSITFQRVVMNIQ